ncbi:MAG: hypothetical protein AB7T10_04925 [bacterium]
MTKRLATQKISITLASMLYFILALLSSKILLIYHIIILTLINTLMLLLMKNEPVRTKTAFSMILHLLFLFFIMGFYDLLLYSVLIFMSVNILIYGIPALFEAKRWFVISLLTMSFSMFSIEVFLRLATNIEATNLYANPKYPQLNVFKDSASLKQSRVHGDLIHEGDDSSECEFREQNFATDRYGYLNSSECYSNPVDIIVLGDSYSAVSSIKQSDIWVEQLKSKTKANVCNLAVSGNEPWQEFVSFFVMKNEISFKDEAVIIWQIFEGNDFKTFFGEVKNDCNYEVSFLVQINEHLENFRKTNNFNRFIHRLQNKELAERKDLIEINTKSGVMHCMKCYLEMANIPLSELEKNSASDNLMNLMKIMRAEANKAGIELVVLFIPSKCSVCKVILEDENSSYSRSGFSLLTEKICRENKIWFIESGYSLFAKSKKTYRENGEFLWWLDDSHLNPAGNKVVADTVMAWLDM